MPFSSTQTAPAGLITDTFVLRPITAADAELDHAAVMESREYLRTWEQSTWPVDGFTVAANREDLASLEQRHTAGTAYTYTVLDPTQTECLGCVYIVPPDVPFLAKAQITPVAEDRWRDVDAAVYFWVRRSQLAAQTDRALLGALRSWLADEWGLARHVVVTNEQFTQQVHLIDSTDLRLGFHIAEPGKPGRYLAYQAPARS
jgi:hypothetical protein